MSFNFQFGDSPSTSSKTPISPVDELEEQTLEALIFAAIRNAARALWNPEILFGGRRGERLFWKSASVKLVEPVVTFCKFGTAFIPEIKFDIGLKITQTRFQFDRGQNYSFILAVDDCIRGITTSATKERDAKNTILVELSKEEIEGGKVLQNGSIFAIYLKGFFSFDDLSGLANGEYRDLIEDDELSTSAERHLADGEAGRAAG